jgi:uncharacterized protein
VYINYPMQIVHGTVATARRIDHIRQMIEQVLFTMPGERVMYPEFGTGLSRVLFETTGTEIVTATQALVASDLHRWLGDLISIQSVTIVVRESRMEVTVAFEMLETREMRREVFAR